MTFPRTIRWRLQLWYGLLLAGLVTGFGLTAHRLERARALGRVDEELRRLLPVLVNSQHPDRLNRERRVLEVRPRDAALFDQPGDRSFYYMVWLKHGEPVTPSASAPAGVPMPRTGEPTLRTRGPWREAFLFPGPGDCVLAGTSLEPDLAALRSLGWALAGVGAAVVLIGLAVGAAVVRRALRPVDEIGAAAAQIAAGDLSRRIRTADTDGELGRLAGVLNSTFARLEAAFAQQSRFTADAAHELRTPVSVILTHAENGLAAPCAEPEHLEAFAAVERAARRMRGLIDPLLQLARLDAGQERLERVPCDLAALAADALALLQPMVASRGAALATSLEPAPCAGDPARLAQVVSNLVANALEHGDAGGPVRVSTGREAGVAVLRVWNAGPVIPGADLPRVFDRFHRGDSSRAGGAHSGLGLAIAKCITDAHAGTLTADSAPGQGTTFTLRLGS